MPTYITLYNFTRQALEDIDGIPGRLDGAAELAESLDGEIKEFYLAMGDHDLVTVSELPNDEVAALVMLRFGQSGLVRSQTLKAWTEEDFREVIANIP